MLGDSSRAVDRGFEDGPRIRMIDHFDPTGVCTRAGIEQGAGCANKGIGPCAIDPEVSREAEMRERVPAAGSAFRTGAGGVAGKNCVHSIFIRDDGGGVDVARRDMRVPGEDQLRFVDRSRTVRVAGRYGGFEECGYGIRR